MTDETIAIDELVQDPANARKHPKRNTDATRASLTRFGAARSIVVDGKGVVRAGNATVEAAKAAGIDKARVIDAHGDELIVVRRKGWSDTEATAYAIADNRTGELAEWDEDVLGPTLEQLRLDPDIDELVTGFDVAEIDALIRGNGHEAEQDEVPEVADGDPLVRAGEVWMLGRHRVICGDATVEGHVSAVLAGCRPMLTVTDPPYGVEYSPTWRDNIAYAANRRTAQPANDDRADWSEAWALAPGEVLYTWTAPGDLAIQAGLGVQQAGFEIRNQCIWVKPNFPISRGHYTYQHEPCWYAVRKGRKSHWIGDPKVSTVWKITPVEIDKTLEEGRGGHSTQKPVECMARPIRNHKGDVYDPFLGSGTTLIAAEQLDRTCYGIEIEPKFMDVIIRRWQQFTGQQATRESDGVKFDDLAH